MGKNRSAISRDAVGINLINHISYAIQLYTILYRESCKGAFLDF